MQRHSREQRITQFTKVNCKNKISGQIWNRWNELGGVKFSLSLIGEQPLHLAHRPGHWKANCSQTGWRNCQRQPPKRIKQINSNRPVSWTEEWNSIKKLKCEPCWKETNKAKANSNQASQTRPGERSFNQQFKGTKMSSKTKYIQNIWRLRSTQKTKVLLSTDCLTSRTRNIQATATLKQACTLPNKFSRRTSERSKEEQSKFGLPLACIYKQRHATSNECRAKQRNPRSER